MTEVRSTASTKPILIEASKGWASLKLGEVWEYRDLLLYLAARDIKIRYKQTLLGISWAVLQPLSTMLIFSVIFGGLAQIPSDNIPYPIFSFAALVPWTFFSSGLAAVSNSLIANSGMIKKVYFPRLILPLSGMMSNLVDFALAFVVLIMMMLLAGYPPTLNILWTPFFLVVAFLCAFGIGLWFAAMNVQFRDVRHAVPFIVRVWMFVTPVIYPTSLLDDPWKTLYALNPMVGVIDGFRWALVGTDSVPRQAIVLSVCLSLGLVISGLFYFRRMERLFADVV